MSEDEGGSDPISNLNEITEKLLLCKQWPSMLLAAKCDYQIGGKATCEYEDTIISYHSHIIVTIALL